MMSYVNYTQIFVTITVRNGIPKKPVSARVTLVSKSVFLINVIFLRFEFVGIFSLGQQFQLYSSQCRVELVLSAHFVLNERGA